jgi:hypothetical protein
MFFPENGQPLLRGFSSGLADHIADHQYAHERSGFLRLRLHSLQGQPPS